jgi:hypothetical protein
MRRVMGSIAVAGALMGTLIVTPPRAAASSEPRRPDAVFTCSGQIAEYYTLQTVTGTVRGTTPRAVTALDWQSLPLTRAKAPALDNAWWGGYWKQTYQQNQWALGHRNAVAYHFMLPDTRLGSTFTALLVSEFDVGGNWQNWMDCTAA